MCGTSETSSETSTKPSPQATTASNAALVKALDIANQTYPGYNPASRVAGFNPDQNAAFDATRNFTSAVPGAATDALGMAKAYGAAPAATVGTTQVGQYGVAAPAKVGYNTIAPTTAVKAGTLATPAQVQAMRVAAERVGYAPAISAGHVANPNDVTAGQVANPNDVTAGLVGTSRVVDETGRLGKVSDYTNPYTSDVLQQTIRELQEAGAKQRVGIGANATAAGAFGDARHGVVESGQMGEEMQGIGDFTMQAHRDAYDRAMALRTTDLDRFLGVDTGNRDATMAAQFGNIDRDIQVDTGNRDATMSAQFGNVDRDTQVATGNRDATMSADTTNSAQQQAINLQNAANKLAADTSTADRTMATDFGNVDRATDAGKFNVTTDVATQTTNAANEQARAMQEAANRIGVDTTNSGYELDAAKTTAGNRLSADQLNQQANLAVSQSNAELSEAQLSRVLQSATSSMEFASASDKAAWEQIAAQLTTGNQQQANTQAMSDAEYEEFLNSREWAFRQLDALLSWAGATPTAQTVNTTTTQPDNSLTAALGAAAGAII